MTLKHKAAYFFAGLLLLCVCALPHMAWAQTTYTDPCPTPQALASAGTSGGLATNYIEDKNINMAAVAAGQTKLQNQQAVRALFAPIDAKLATCFTQMQAIFAAIGSHGDPLALIDTLIAGVILSMIQQVCSAVMADLNQIKNFINSQVNRLCIPLPNFGLGLGGLNLKPVTCNGVSLLQPGPSTTGKDPYNIDIRSLFPTSSSPGSSTPATTTIVP